MDLGLHGHVVLVTGAAGAIGTAVAHEFAREGAQLVVADQDADGLARLLRDLPGSAHVAHQVTLGGRASAEELVNLVLRHHGRIDVLAHLAAILQTTPVSEVSEESWDAHMGINVSSTFFVSRAVAESMKARDIQGRIVIMSSGAWLSGGLPTRLPYAATKGAVTTMARSLAKEYGPDGITVNTIAPGLIDTPMMSAGLTAESRNELELATPLRRFGTPEEIAAVTVFMCSRPASFVSGATFNVSGGNTLY